MDLSSASETRNFLLESPRDQVAKLSRDVKCFAALDLKRADTVMVGNYTNENFDILNLNKAQIR